jgi:hypothetical protein
VIEADTFALPVRDEGSIKWKPERDRHAAKPTGLEFELNLQFARRGVVKKRRTASKGVAVHRHYEDTFAYSSDTLDLQIAHAHACGCLAEASEQLHSLPRRILFLRRTVVFFTMELVV